MSVVIYGDGSKNNVTINNALLQNWTQEIVMDPSGTDVWFNRINFTVAGIIHYCTEPEKNQPVWMGTGSLDEIEASPQIIYANIIGILGTSRMILQVFNNDTASGPPILNVASARDYAVGTSIRSGTPIPGNFPPLRTSPFDGTDVDNGPKPKVFSISAIAGAKVLRVTMGFECCLPYSLNTAANLTSPEVLGNRWSVTEEMDDDYRVTRTISGHMRVSRFFSSTIYQESDIDTAEKQDWTTSPSYFDYRYLMIPSLEYGFKRSRVKVTNLPNSLEAEYTVIDRQIHYSAPWPATRFSATHRELTHDGMTLISHISVQVVGSLDVPKVMLGDVAMAIADARLNFIANKNYHILMRSYSDDIGESNAVSLEITIQRQGADGKDLRDVIGAVRAVIWTPFDAVIPQTIASLAPAMADRYFKDDDGKSHHDSTYSRLPATYGYSQPSGYAVQGKPESDSGGTMSPTVYNQAMAGQDRQPAVLAIMRCYQQTPFLDPTGKIPFAGQHRINQLYGNPIVPPATPANGQVNKTTLPPFMTPGAGGP